ncbi:MAG: hypothetical protein NTZ74_06885 [Chloroflexi bacterium]|nr:hypothetical protein [Chloroflexota bacterium]
MDLYDALQKSQVLFAELNAAAAEEYMYPGRQVATIKSICKNGLSIFAIYFN